MTNASAPYTLILLRHGESEWNAKNLFTGWVDVDLSEKGMAEARRGGELLAEAGLYPDVVHTSLLKRAIKTAQIALEACDRMWLPVVRNWRLNERHYGALQGLNKTEMVERHGIEQVQIWRRSYDTPPPALTLDDPRYNGNDPRFADMKPGEFPLTECLKDTVARFLPLWHETIAPTVKAGKRVVIAAHGNSLRALVKYLDNVPENKIVELNIPTGIPLVYELNDDLTPIRSYYLGDPEAVKKATDAVADQLKKK